MRTWDRAGAVGPYAVPARFVTGLHDDDWKAAWIRRPGAEKMPTEDYSLFRKEASAGASPVVRAPSRHVGRSTVRPARQRHARRARPVVRVSRRAVLRDDRHHRDVHGRRIERVRVRHALVDPRPGPPGVGPGAHRADHDRSRRRHPRGRRDRRDAGAAARGPWMPGPPAQRRGRLRRAHRRAARARSAGTRPASTTTLGTAAVLGPHPGRAVHASRPGAHAHRRASDRRRCTFEHAAPTARTSPTSAQVIAATPVVRSRSTAMPGRAVTLARRLPARPRRPRVDDARRTRTPTCTGTSTNERARSSSARSAISASATSRSTAPAEPLDAADVALDARHAAMPDEHAARVRDLGSGARRGLGPRPPLRALRRPGTVPRHADAREGPVPRRLLRRVAGDDGRVRRTRADVPGAARLRAIADALLARRPRQRRLSERRRQA